jgi:fatty acid-binding protein DegV
MPSSNAFYFVTDAAADLPEAALAHPRLRTMPVHVVSNGKQILDIRDIAQTRAFYKYHLALPSTVSAFSDPLSIDEMTAYFGNALANGADEILGVFVTSTRSAMFARAKEATKRARMESFPRRINQGKSTAILADCVDSRALFSGYSAQVLDLLDLIDRGAGIMQTLERQQALVPHSYTYMAADDFDFILKRAALKGESSVNPLVAFAARTLGITPIIRAHLGQTTPIAKHPSRAKARESLFALAQRLIEERALFSPHVCFGYSGPIEEVIEMPGYAEVCECAGKVGVKVHLSHTSMTSSVNVGPRALNLGVIAKPHTV